MDQQRNTLQGIWQQLPYSMRNQLIKLVPFVLLGTVLVIVVVPLLLIGAGLRVIEWVREEPSAYSAMDNRTYTHCLRRAHHLYKAANESVRLENSPGLAGENAYRRWLQQARDFDKQCGPANWPGQTVPQHPADWLPHLGLAKTDWPEQVPAYE